MVWPAKQEKMRTDYICVNELGKHRCDVFQFYLNLYETVNSHPCLLCGFDLSMNETEKTVALSIRCSQLVMYEYKQACRKCCDQASLTVLLTCLPVTICFSSKLLFAMAIQ